METEEPYGPLFSLYICLGQAPTLAEVLPLGTGGGGIVDKVVSVGSGRRPRELIIQGPGARRDNFVHIATMSHSLITLILCHYRPSFPLMSHGITIHCSNDMWENKTVKTPAINLLTSIDSS
ncbi:hypothetical protein E2C01_042949 [Portunus trituberculatus]|uniref:Uncharacterized protein n=1 Tax=Portunus trituberculatus TaxID=210409 RepID=A0A5B7FXW7_PORTR|nr:hypothetical protein [Portunus trituberculatus]